LAFGAQEMVSVMMTEFVRYLSAGLADALRIDRIFRVCYRSPRVRRRLKDVVIMNALMIGGGYIYLTAFLAPHVNSLFPGWDVAPRGILWIAWLTPMYLLSLGTNAVWLKKVASRVARKVGGSLPGWQLADIITQTFFWQVIFVIAYGICALLSALPRVGWAANTLCMCWFNGVYFYDAIGPRKDDNLATRPQAARRDGSTLWDLDCLPQSLPIWSIA
jgi:hypothetical protein